MREVWDLKGKESGQAVAEAIEVLLGEARKRARKLSRCPQAYLSSPSTFGCGCDTPDQAGQNPVLGSGGARVIQLGLKIIF